LIFLVHKKGFPLKHQPGAQTIIRGCKSEVGDDVQRCEQRPLQPMSNKLGWEICGFFEKKSGIWGFLCMEDE
jgi:hypothetical protein